jgi:hypothetical protein
MQHVYIVRTLHCQASDILIYKIGITNAPFKMKTIKYLSREPETHEDEFDEFGINRNYIHEKSYYKKIKDNGRLEELEEHLFDELSEHFVNHLDYGPGYFEGCVKDMELLVDRILKEYYATLIDHSENLSLKNEKLENIMKEQNMRIIDLETKMTLINEELSKLNGKSKFRKNF